MSVEIRTLRGAEIAPHLEALATLRIAVFRDWPYLYDGDMDYERDYLRAYQAEGALVVGAFDGDRMVGAATAAPMEDHAQDFASAFAGQEPSDIYYLAESVLLPDWRGQGLGHRFFDAREDAGRALGRARACFCSVIRPDDHPARPAAPRTYDHFWRGRGYAPLPGVTATFQWRDVGTAEETAKRLQFWSKAL
ncbi:MAG: GNAT family N-acetyltransferase [Pseudomonadota bacterium]